MTGVSKNNILKATKWSVLTELVAKLITPISTMVLARLLTPDAFGILVTATMVISFAEMFTDAGFQKYLIQHEFDSEEDQYKSTTVAFWTNFSLSTIVWLLIYAFSDAIATWVGNPGYGCVIVVSALCIPVAAFSSIQMALYKRHFDFRTLFFVKIAGIMVPLFFTIPLAFITRSYWSLILGMLLLNLINAIVLSVKSPWKPNLYYDFGRLKSMLSFSIWTLAESISIWLTAYVDIFLVGTTLNQYYLGIYRTSMSTVAQITSVIVAAITPVLFSTLSRLQNDDDSLKKAFLKFQRNVGVVLIPLSIGIYLFPDLIVAVILGEQWREASYFIGWWGATSAIVVIVSQFGSELYRAKGKPRLSLISQLLHLAALIPVVLIFINHDFYELCFARSMVRFEGVAVNLFILFFVFRVSIISMVRNFLPALSSSLVMFVCVKYALPSFGVSSPWIQIAVAISVYFFAIMLFPEDRRLIVAYALKMRKGKNDKNCDT